MNAKPTVPLALVALLITGAGGTTESVNVAVPVPPEFDALSGIVYVPVAVGVPEIKPLDVFTDTPDGRPVAL